MYTWYFNFKQREGFNQEYGYPAESVREHDKEKAVGHGHVFVQPTAHICGIDACFINGTEHAGIGNYNHQEGHQI